MTRLLLYFSNLKQSHIVTQKTVTALFSLTNPRHRDINLNRHQPRLQPRVDRQLEQLERRALHEAQPPH